MTREQFNIQWHRMRRMWIKPHEHGDYDDQCDALWDEIKQRSFDQFRACVDHLVKTFKPKYRHEMPNMADFSEAESVIAQQIPQPSAESHDVIEDLEYVQEIEARIEALSREERATLRTKATAWALEHIPAFLWDVGPNSRKAVWRISEANIFCRENGMRVPKPYANVKPLKSIGKKCLVKSMDGPTQVDTEKRRTELHRQARQGLTR